MPVQFTFEAPERYRVLLRSSPATRTVTKVVTVGHQSDVSPWWPVIGIALSSAFLIAMIAREIAMWRRWAVSRRRRADHYDI